MVSTVVSGGKEFFYIVSSCAVSKDFVFCRKIGRGLERTLAASQLAGVVYGSDRNGLEGDFLYMIWQLLCEIASSIGSKEAAGVQETIRRIGGAANGAHCGASLI